MYIYVYTCFITFTGNKDYHPGPYNVTFPAGETRVSFNVSIVDDDLVEKNESFNLYINGRTLPTGGMTLSPYSVSVTVEDYSSK